MRAVAKLAGLLLAYHRLSLPKLHCCSLLPNAKMSVEVKTISLANFEERLPEIGAEKLWRVVDELGMKKERRRQLHIGATACLCRSSDTAAAGAVAAGTAFPSHPLHSKKH